ncbi:hypothetical protein [Flavobacterium aciduliphilum]|uniref:Response regulator receiver domain-containing protein n=1 Tax=Flavobacterium aciduliphilum TaxID=1101402 RepID=A0A328YP97_9FLAO|nr:hypothetical protein [Flavobacterium aciduliphilum]RAR75689.1 hypothetical protein CLV55_101389 [Flavobacterium aciduliphilum]
MKNGGFNKIGKLLMKISPMKIIIIDDVKSYFNENMLSIASANGNISFERYYKCDGILLKNLIENPRDILIIDIKGTVTEDIGKDGFNVASHVFNNTNTFVATTSAHKFHLKNRENYGDYIISERLMTPVDFCEELNIMIEKYLKQKTKIYQKVIYKLGKYFFKYGLNKP